jgi:putative ABC transport system ATP-binding protein
VVGPRRTGTRVADRAGTACRAEAVSKVYGRRETAVHALRDVSLDIPSGAFTAIMGPSGSGKSTLLHCLAALDTPTTGRVFLGPTELTALSRRQQAQVRRDRIGFVFQAFNLVPTLDAIENITLPQLLAGRRPDGAWLDHIVRRVGLADRLYHRPSELSGGQQQRVALARALAGRPEVIFADEPTGNLDTSAGQEMLTLLRDAVDQFEQTVITVTHDPSITRYADRVLFLRDGQVVDEAHRPDIDQVVGHPRFGDGAGGDDRPDELHVPRPDGRDSMRSRRRRQRGEPAPGRPMVGSDDEVEVARQERWLQRIREQFEAEQQTDGRDDDGRPAEADPWTTEPAIEQVRPELPPTVSSWQADEQDDRHDAGPFDDAAVRAPETPHHAEPAPADDGWLPAMRSWQLRDRDDDHPDHEPTPPRPAWRDERARNEAPWSRPVDPDERDDQQATTSQWAPPDGEWPPLEHSRPRRPGWQTDSVSWARRLDDDADVAGPSPEGSPSGDRRNAGWTPPRDDDRWTARDEREHHWTPPEEEQRDAWASPDDQREPWTPPDDQRDAWTPSTTDDHRWSTRHRGADRRAAHDDEGFPADDAGQHPSGAGDHPHLDPTPGPGATWDAGDDQPAQAPRYQTWQAADDGGEANGYRQPDTPPRSPSRNGFHLDDMVGGARDEGAYRNGRRPSPRDDRPVPGPSRGPVPDDTRPPSPNDRRGPEQRGDASSNVRHATSGIDVADVGTPALDPGAPDRGESREQGPPAADTDERVTTTDDPREPLHPGPVDGDDEIVQPVLHRGPLASEREDEPEPSPRPTAEAASTDELELTSRPAADDPTPRPAAEEPPTAAPARTGDPTDDGGRQPLPTLPEATHDETIETPAASASRAPGGRGLQRPPGPGDDTLRDRRPRRRRPGTDSDDTELPAALASLRNTRRPDETADPMAALQSLQAQLDRLGATGGRHGGRTPRRPDRAHPAPGRDRD